MQFYFGNHFKRVLAQVSIRVESKKSFEFSKQSSRVGKKPNQKVESSQTTDLHRSNLIQNELSFSIKTLEIFKQLEYQKFYFKMFTRTKTLSPKQWIFFLTIHVSLKLVHPPWQSFHSLLNFHLFCLKH